MRLIVDLLHRLVSCVSSLVIVTIDMVEVMEKWLCALSRVVKLFILMGARRGCPSALISQRI